MTRAQVVTERLLGLAMPERSQQQQLQKELDHKEWELSEEEVWEMASFHGAAYAQSSYGAAAAVQVQKAIESTRNSNLLPRSGSSTSLSSQRFSAPSSAPIEVPDAEIAIRSAGAKKRAAGGRSLSILIRKNLEDSGFRDLYSFDNDDDDYSFDNDDDDYSFGPPHKPKITPPHLILSCPPTHNIASSVMEGAGRTLKGRDLRNVRNAVWKQTGFFG